MVTSQTSPEVVWPFQAIRGAGSLEGLDACLGVVPLQGQGSQNGRARAETRHFKLGSYPFRRPPSSKEAIAISGSVVEFS